MLQQVLLYGLTFISGLFFGSFFNLVADRIPKGKKIVKGRSECDFCHHKLAPKDLIPVLSFLSTKGKCRYCHKKLSWYYPFSEILTGIFFVGAAHLSGIFTVVSFKTVVTFIYLAVISGFYVTLLLTDLKYRLIPDKIVIPGIIFILIYMVYTVAFYYFSAYLRLKNDSFGTYLLEAGYLKVQLFIILERLGVVALSSLGIAIFFALLVFFTKGRGMGGGDIRLGIFIGLFNGFPFNIMAIFFGFVIGAFVSLVLVLLRRKTLKDTVPFGPFLITGSLIALLWGTTLWQFYASLF